MPVTFDTETIKLVTLFENLTNVSVKDCLVDENNTVYFVVDEGKIAKAIGKNGIGIKHTERLIKRDVRVIEFSNDIDKFVKNMIPQVNSIRIKKENDRTTVEIWIDKSYKAIVIGRDGRNLKFYKELLQRCHGISNVMVR